MYRHLLIPIDGSPVSENAALAALKLAGEWGARATVVHVLPGEHPLAFAPAPGDAGNASAASHPVFRPIVAAASRGGVDVAFLLRQSDRAASAIVAVAIERRCDLIAMASHGRRGLAGLVAGSQTQKVLAHSRVPVLVFNTD
ncbi:nucleotide-binding universal stress UspA family protein [Pseudoduganella lurida]|uniref:Nucleotide-binding universal stress UspA family protein n=1 Tax=Pseudoduganella lurida TaxID=1036180 RepID=A0A562RKY7_9BURK|nr:universal stress protein [Pseudoduganella lurida]TWI69681.1 nucleotide-binding universal stress UspA family protein [Pseudoduganella lurida]